MNFVASFQLTAFDGVIRPRSCGKAGTSVRTVLREDKVCVAFVGDNGPERGGLWQCEFAVG